MIKRLLWCIFILVALVSVGCYWANDAQRTVQRETAPSTMLKRYEWFKDAAAQLDAKRATIEAYDKKFKNLSDEYKGVPRSKWAREDREQWNLWQSEVAGLKGSYNTLAAEYNSNMAKINYAYTNVGELPKGADKPLPREFRQYETN